MDLRDYDELLVVRTARTSIHNAHIPDPDEPDTPLCHVQVQTGEWELRDSAVIPGHITLCDFCNPDVEYDPSVRSGRTPEDVLRETGHDPESAQSDRNAGGL